MGYDEYGAMGNFGGIPKGHGVAGFVGGVGRNIRKKAQARQAANEQLSRQMEMAKLNANIRAVEREHAHGLSKDKAVHGAALQVAVAEEMARVSNEKERGRRAIFHEERQSASVDKARAARMKELEKERPSFVGNDSSSTIGASVTTTDTPADIAARNAAWQEAKYNKNA